MACPICASPDGSAINDGIRAGAGVLILVSTVVIGLIVRFGVTLWRSETAEGAESVDSLQ